MPKTGAWNRLDILIYYTLFCLGAEVAGAVITYNYEMSDKPGLALIFDWITFVIVIGGYPVLNLAIFLRYGPLSGPCCLWSSPCVLQPATPPTRPFLDHWRENPDERPKDHSLVPPERIYIPKQELGAIGNPYKLDAWGTEDYTDDRKNGKPKPFKAGKATDQKQY